jgi:hypothetical protein
VTPANRSLDDTLELLVNYVYLARLCRPGSEERDRYLTLAAKLLEEEHQQPTHIAPNDVTV